MAIINSYPLATPKLTDLVLGTSTSSAGQTSTKSFTVESIKDTTAGVKTIVSSTLDTLTISGSGTSAVTIGTLTAAVTDGSAALTTGNDVYDFVVGKITGTADTVPIWTTTTTLGDSLISQAANGVIINGNSTDGKLTLNCSATTHGVTLQSPPHSAGATYTWVLPQSAGTAGQVLTSGVKTGVADQLTWTDNGNIGGTGTQNKLSKWSNTTTLADSNVEDTGTLVTISSAAKVTGNLELDADLLDVNGATGAAGQLLSSLGPGAGVDWIPAPATGVASLSTTNTNLITITSPGTTPHTGAVVATPNISGGVSSSSSTLATGTQIQAAIDLALAGAVTFKGTFNASTGQITGGSDYLYNPGANSNTIAVAVGDMYVVSVAGNFFGNASTGLNVGDEVIAVTQSTISPSNSQESYYNAVPSAGGGITGGGTTNKVPLWTGTTVLGDSAIAQSSNNIGIGTTSPSAPLDVRRSDTSGMVAEFHNSAGYGINIDVESDGGVNTIGSATNQALAFVTNGGSNERMRIDIAGNVGIGTSSLVQKLTVAGNIDIAGGNGGNLTFNNGDARIVVNNNGSGRDLSFQTYNGSSTAEKMRLTQTGDLGIGTTSPSVSLDVNATDAIQVPAGTTAQRPTAANGMLRYSTTDNQFEGYVDGAWGAIAGGGGGSRTVTLGTGDGTTTDFTMGVAFTSVAYVDVYISGVYQQKATYSQPNGTGTTLLRFTTAPPATSTNGIDFVINH